MRRSAGGPTVRDMTTSDGGDLDLAVRRVYEEPEEDDGARVLVDRLWPRGVSKVRARLDAWPKELAPSDELRRWMHEDPDGRYDEFARRYRRELEADAAASALADVRDLAEHGPVALLTAAKDVDHSHVPVLVSALREG